MEEEIDTELELPLPFCRCLLFQSVPKVYLQIERKLKLWYECAVLLVLKEVKRDSRAGSI